MKKLLLNKEYKIHIINSQVIPEAIIITKKIRKIASFAESSFIYTRLVNSEVRAICLYKLYEEKAKEFGIKKNILNKIYQYHQLFELLNPSDDILNYHTNISNLGYPFFISS